jgi:probable O-glycosylation ligase (exosortase A-associated)
MSLRSLFLLAFVFASLPFIFRNPYLGALMWSWLGFMNPHKLTFGFTQFFPFAAIVAAVTILGLLASKEPKRMPWCAVVVLWLLFWLWTSLSYLQAENPQYAWEEFSRFGKINFMLIVTMLLLTSRRRIEGLLVVVVGSLFFYGVKGGIFTLRGGGEGTVWGPEKSFIAGNNELAFALVVVMPLAWYFYEQYYRSYKWVRYGLPVVGALTVLSILGSQSRGAFLAVAAMLVVFWVRARRKLMPTLLIAFGAVAAVAFMPADWTERMQSIQEFQLDKSAQGRINAWKTAINLANDQPLMGGGFRTFTKEVFAKYAPDPTNVRDVHSIYFEVLGEQGYVGLALYLLMGIVVLVTCSRIIGLGNRYRDLSWAADLARMAQVSFIGYAVGGAFLGLAYFDLPYTIMALVACTYAVAREQIRTAEEKAKLPMPQPVMQRPAQANWSRPGA